MEHGLRRLSACLIALAFLVAALPIASADDDMASANTALDGTTHSEWVCDGEGCSNGNDVRDFWKIFAFTGDRVEVTVSGSMSNPDTGICTVFGLFTDGWEGHFNLYDQNGQKVTGPVDINSDGPTSQTVSYNVLSAQDIFVEIVGEDTNCNDEISYQLTIVLDKYNRDTDDDGWVDRDDDCDDEGGTSSEDLNGCPDLDRDGWSDQGDTFPDDATQWEDSDGDGWGDNPAPANNPDSCPQFFGASMHDREGCPDSDGDGFSDPSTIYSAEPWGVEHGADAFWWPPTDTSAENVCGTSCDTQWSDFDGDGLGDNWWDARWNQTHHSAGIGEWIAGAILEDACPVREGYSSEDRPGCPDADSDGWSDPEQNWTTDDGADAFPSIPSQWKDTDGDGYGDNQTEGAERVDDFPINPTQWRDTDGDGWGDNQANDATQVDDFPVEPSQFRDTDGDGFGDNLSGFEGDVCPEIRGFSYLDRFGCIDSDTDGYSDPDSGWAAHPVGFADALPYETSQWHDTDGDGFGDNQSSSAWQPDGCLLTEGTSYRDRWGCPDQDQDGASDPDFDWLSHPLGLADAFPTDITQWLDTDGDGYGDNPVGTTADSCIEDPGTSRDDRFGCRDTDGDGWSDLGDLFPHDPTQRADTDGDGWGDNSSGHEPDACPFSAGDSLLDRRGCPDVDEDGYSDGDQDWFPNPDGAADAFPSNPLQWRDSDGDGYGDNPIGNLRDDCPHEAGTSTIDVQGCPDKNGDGYSDEFGESRAAMTIMGQNPMASWATYAIGGLVFLLALIVNRVLEGSPEEELMFDG